VLKTEQQLFLCGTGSSSEGATRFEETICGAVSGTRLEYYAVYTTVVPGYTIDGVAAVAADGTAVGTGQGADPRGASQTFTSTITKLKVACLPRITVHDSGTLGGNRCLSNTPAQGWRASCLPRTPSSSSS
jgi:hypothetical protein